MEYGLDPLRYQDVFRTLRERFAQLGQPLWIFPAATPLPHHDNPGLPPEAESALGKWLSRSECGSIPGRIPLTQSLQLLALESRIGATRLAVVATPARSDEPGNEVQTIISRSAAAAIDAAIAAGGLPDLSARQLESMLSWMHDDLFRACDGQNTLEQFSERLTQAYEETNLLFRMARLLNCRWDAGQMIQTIAGQIQQIMPFQWIALRFTAGNDEVPGLSDGVLIAGTPPCEVDELDSLVLPLLREQNEDNWMRLLPRDSNPLTRRVGSEVLAEPIAHDGRIVGMLVAGNKTGPDVDLSSFETQFFEAAADFLGIFHENMARFAEQRAMFMGTLRSLTASIDAKDSYTCGHSERVAILAAQMAAAMGLDDEHVEQYRIAGLVHDVGKIGVPEAVLCKRGKLDDAEFAQIKLHPQIGHEILRGIPALQQMLPGVLCHHERWDGNGYPNRFAGEQIPMIARVLALADTFDAMSSNRSYRPALPREAVVAEILRCAGTQFDPALAPIFTSLDFSIFDALLLKHSQKIGVAA